MKTVEEIPTDRPEAPGLSQQATAEEDRSELFDFDLAADTISIEVAAIQRKNGSISNVSVVHIFRAPTSKEINQYRRLLSKVRGRSVKTDFMGAANFLWNKCITDVTGYANLPEDWRHFFTTNPKAQIHIQSAVDGLIEVVVPDAEMLKN